MRLLSSKRFVQPQADIDMHLANLQVVVNLGPERQAPQPVGQFDIHKNRISQILSEFHKFQNENS